MNIFLSLRQLGQTKQADMLYVHVVNCVYTVQIVECSGSQLMEKTD